MPSEVFPELGVGGRYLGRVYISLWCHMRWVQLFLTLCLGTLGPSLLGAEACESLRNILMFDSVVFRSNEIIEDNLLMGLGWGSQHSTEESEGLVCGKDGSDGIAFGINTQDQANATLEASFGKVIAGLEVVKEAFQHNPIFDVIITHCGIVLPVPSQ